MAKFISIDEAVALIPDGATIMFGGFMGCGNAHKIIDALSKSGKGGFTVISNDAAMPNGPDGGEYYGIAKLVHNKQIKKGGKKILDECRLPYTAVNCVDMIVTEMCVLLVTPEGLLMTEINPEFTVEQVQEATEAPIIVSSSLKPMAR